MNDVHHVFFSQPTTPGVHRAEQYAFGDNNEKLKVGLAPRLRSMNILQLNDQVLGVRAIPVAQLSVTVEIMLPIDRLSLVRISTEILGRTSGTHTHNSDDRHDDGTFRIIIDRLLIGMTESRGSCFMRVPPVRPSDCGYSFERSNTTMDRAFTIER